jgi:adenosylmethionine-8-amino-7-oxononanoate aminotransferase
MRKNGDRHHFQKTENGASPRFLSPRFSERLVADDKAYLWHPFTPMKQWIEGEPVVVESAEGFELIDTRGNRYIDGFSSLWCNLHGHRVPKIDAAIREQLARAAHTTLLGFASPPSIELARRLVEVVASVARTACPYGSRPCVSRTSCPRVSRASRPRASSSVASSSSSAEVEEAAERRRNERGQDALATRGQDARDTHGRDPYGQAAHAALAKVFFSDSGATAVEVGLKMAFQYFQNVGRPRRKFLALRESYHGDTIGAVSVGGIDTFHALFRPLLFPVTFVDSPNPYHHPAGAGAGDAVLKQIENALAAEPDQYAAVVLEPLIQAAAGMLTHPPGFLAGLRQLTRHHGVLLIADEVATGFCRTGRLFACEHEGITPDILCLGKGLSGGYLPVAATLATQEIFDAFLGEAGEGRTFYHGHTFTGNALGCAAACASIDLIFESGLLDKLPAKVEYIRSRLAELAGHPHVGDIRQCGMMVGIELLANGKSGDSPHFQKTENGDSPRFSSPQFAAAVCHLAMRHGLIIRPLGDVVVLMPAPAMDAGTLERMMSAVLDSIHETFREN